MYKFLDINTFTRKKLTILFKNLSTHFDKYEAAIQYYQYFENIKVENYEFYQYIIGLLFIDNYRLLSYRNQYNNLSEEEKNVLDSYQEIQSLDDLLFLIEQDPSLFHTMAFSSIKFQSLNQNGKASILMSISDEYALQFNKYTLIEKESMVGNHSIEDLILEYHSVVNKENGESDESLRAQGVDTIETTMKILFNYNLKNYHKLVLTMLLSFYKFKKYVQFHFPEWLFEPEKELIQMIENSSIEEVIYELSYDENLFELLLEEFFTYEVDCKILDKQDIDHFFEQQVSQDVKIKLKET